MMFLSSMMPGLTSSQTYKIVDGGQIKCYDANREITPPLPGQPFYGQDAQYSGNKRSYALSGDGKTVYDNNTQLTWMRGPNTTNTHPLRANKLTTSQAQAWVPTVNSSSYGGFKDWRIPTLKELYSLFNCLGTDPSGYSGTDLSVLTPFIDTTYFNFGWGQTELGERVIDSQYGTTTVFVVNPAETGYPKLFGVNFADGRIKGYDLIMPDGRTEKTFFWQLVRGGTTYGTNKFIDNSDQTITDQATGLMWSKSDNGSGISWQDALAWVQTKNAQNFLGHGDWRLPDVKELQSIVNYSNSPDYNGLPAIDTRYFVCSSITNENGQADFPYYWTSSTHGAYGITGSVGAEADYVAFGRALGWPSGAPSWIDVHGAGAQRSDPKTGPPFNQSILHTVTAHGVTYTGYSWGPQGDAIRGLNFVRLVRNATSATGIDNGSSTPSYFRLEQNYPNPFNPTTKIFFQLTTRTFVTLKVYDFLGREIQTLANGMREAGEHSLVFNGQNCASGVYFYTLWAGGFPATKQMILVK